MIRFECACNPQFWTIFGIWFWDKIDDARYTSLFFLCFSFGIRWGRGKTRQEKIIDEMIGREYTPDFKEAMDMAKRIAKKGPENDVD
jgi:hypothetical protein